MCGEVRGQLREVGSPHPLSVGSWDQARVISLVWQMSVYQLSRLAGSELLIFKTISCGKIYVA